MFERVPIEVMLCCNNPNNGCFAGRLYAIEIGPNMTFSGVGYSDRDCMRMRWLTDKVALGGRHFEVSNHKEWVGNWCWDRVHMPGEDVLKLLNWPRFRRFFELAEAEVRLSNWWHAKQPWTDQDLRFIGKDFG